MEPKLTSIPKVYKQIPIYRHIASGARSKFGLVAALITAYFGQLVCAASEMGREQSALTDV